MSANGAVVAGNTGGGMGGINPVSMEKWRTDPIAWQHRAGSTCHSRVAGWFRRGRLDRMATAGHTQPFEWTNGVVTPLTLPAGYVTGSATAVSTDGATIVGLMSPPANGGRRRK